MADTQGKTKTKRPSKSERMHQRRLKEVARKPGGAMALQLAKTQAAADASKKEKTTASPTPLPGSPTAGEPKK